MWQGQHHWIGVVHLPLLAVRTYIGSPYIKTNRNIHVEHSVIKGKRSLQYVHLGSAGRNLPK